MNSFIGLPSNTNYFEVYSLFLRYLRTALELEEKNAASSRPTHDTMRWYQVLCFGGTPGEEALQGSESLAGSQGLATGLTALLNRMQIEQGVRFYVCTII